MTITSYLILSSLIMFVCALTPYISIPFFLWELLSHFQMQYLRIVVLLIIICFIAATHSKWPIIFSLMLSVCIIGYTIHPWFSHSKKAQAKNENSITILQSNVLKLNTDTQPIIDFTIEQNPDIAVFLETTSLWIKKLDILKKHMPYSIIHPSEGSYGVAIFSKHPLSDIRNSPAISEDIPSYYFTAKIKGSDVAFATMHPPTPMNSFGLQARDKHFQDIIDWSNKQKTPHIMTGDLNVTMFSPSFKKILSDTSLLDSRHGYDLFPTWPANFPSFFRIPIDHTLYSPDFEVTKFKTSKNLSSDHLATVTTLHLKEQKPETSIHDDRANIDRDLIKPQ